MTGKLFYELTKYSYHFKTAVATWFISFVIILIITIVLLIISFQKFIDQKNKQMEKIENENSELEKKLSNAKHNHETNLNGQLASKERIKKERDDYIARNAELEAINNNQILLLKQMLATTPKPELVSLVSANIAQDEIESQVLNNVRNQED